MKKLFSVLLAALLAVGLFSGCGQSGESDWSYIQEKDVMKIGITLFEPMNYYDPEDPDILAPMSNEVITLVKDTSLARVIAVGEVIRAAQDITAQRALLWPLFHTGVFYLVFNGGLTLLFGWAEKKLNYYRG